VCLDCSRRLRGKAAAPTSYYDPFSKKRIAVGGPSKDAENAGSGNGGGGGQTAPNGKRQCLADRSPAPAGGGGAAGVGKGAGEGGGGGSDLLGDGLLPKKRGGKARPDLAAKSAVDAGGGHGATAHGGAAGAAKEPCRKKLC